MKYFLFAIILLLTGVANAQVKLQKTFTANGWRSTIISTSDGGYAITAFIGPSQNHDIVLIKTDENLDTIWTKAYGDSLTDRVYDIIQTSDDGYLMVGSSFNYALYNGIIIKTDNSGNILWSKGFKDVVFSSIDKTNDGGYIMAGGTLLGAGNADLNLTKFDSNYQIEWTKTYGGLWNEQMGEVHETSDGGYIISGLTGSYVLIGSKAVYLIKTDAIGDTLWTKAFVDSSGGTDYSKVCVRETGNGYLLLSTLADYNISSYPYLLVTSVDLLGNVIWAKTYGDYYRGDFAKDMVNTSFGGFVIMGESRYESGDSTSINIIEITLNGDTVWTREYGKITSQTGESGNSIIQGNDGGYVIVGNTNSFGVNNYLYVIKTDSFGNSGCYEYVPPTDIKNINLLVSAGAIITDTGGVDSVITPMSYQPLIYETIICDSTTGLTENSYLIEKIVIYPNPTTGQFTIQGATDEIQIFDLFGRLVLRTNKEQIDMSGYPAGIYIVKAGEAVRKLILN